MKMKPLMVLMLSVAMLFAFAAQSMAATDNIVISAKVNSKITVTAGADHDFGSFDPDASNPTPYEAPVTVRSNVPYTFARSFTSNTFLSGMLSINTPTGMDGSTANSKAVTGFAWPQTYTLNLRPGDEWQSPGSYSADILYTAVATP